MRYLRVSKKEIVPLYSSYKRSSHYLDHGFLTSKSKSTMFHLSDLFSIIKSLHMATEGKTSPKEGSDVVTWCYQTSFLLLFFLFSLTTNQASIVKQRCLCQTREMLYHNPRYQERMLPTCASDNRQKGFPHCGMQNKRGQ